MEFNKAINPKEGNEEIAVSLMATRAEEVKKVIASDAKNGVGGMTDVKTGNVWIPTGDSAYERTIRSHEAMHAAHTSRKFKPADKLDQALEDGRLHRYCSRSSASAYQQNRQDELETVRVELAGLLTQPAINASSALVAFRDYAILKAGKHPTDLAQMMDAVLSRFDKDAPTLFSRALIYLASAEGTGTENWNKARKALQLALHTMREA